MNCPELTTVTLNSGLISMGSNTFKGCNKLGTLSIPSTVTTIGANSFDGTIIKTLIIPDAVTTLGNDNLSGVTELKTLTTPCDLSFTGNKNLTTVTVKSVTGRTAIPDNAYKGCTALNTVNLPSGLTGIGVSAFENCTNLPEPSFTNNIRLTTIGDNAYKGTRTSKLTIPDSVTTMRDPGVTELSVPCTLAITGNSTVTTITVRTKSNSTSVPNSAYKNCSSVTSITLPYGLTSIGATVFDGCTRLTSLSIPVTVTSLGDILEGSSITHLSTPGVLTFSKNTGSDKYVGNSKLTNVTLKNGPYGSYVAESAFDNCSNLNAVTLNGISEIKARAFAYSGLQTIDLSNVEYIRRVAFANCTNLESIGTGTLSNLKSGGLENAVFDSCSALRGTITIPSTITTIPEAAFRGCSKADFKFIGSNISEVCDSAFSSSGITSFPNNNKLSNLTIGNNAFSWCSKLTQEVTLDESNTVASAAFQYSNITKAFLSCTEIPNSLFSNCENLSSVQIISNGSTQGVQRIGSQPFISCPNLTTLDFKDSTSSSYSTWGSPDQKHTFKFWVKDKYNTTDNITEGLFNLNKRLINLNFEQWERID